MLMKFKSVAGLSLVAITSVLCADSLSPASSSGTKKCPRSVINPSANPSVKDGYDVFLFGQFLYWKAEQGGLPIGVKNEGNPLPFANLRDASITNLHGKWDAGLRLGLGYVLPHDGWDMSLTWLRFNPSHKHQSMHGGGSTLIFPSLTAATDPIAQDNGCTFAQGHWGLKLDQLDLDLGREFYVSKWLTLRPHAGIRTDWIEQRVKVEYADFLGGPGLEDNAVEVQYKDEWWGIGIEGGLDTQWDLGRGWSIFADIALAILYGEHAIKFHEEDSPGISNNSNFASAIPDGLFANVKEHVHIAHPVLDLQLGLRWDWNFSKDRLHFALQAGWENHIYFSQNQFPNFSDDFNFGKFFANQGDLTLQGWTLGARFDF